MFSIEQQIQAAQLYYKQANYESCQQILLSLAVNYIMNPEQYILLALSYLRPRQYQQATQILQFIIFNKLTSKQTQSEAVSLLAQAYIEQQMYSEAYELINKYTIQDNDLQQFIKICYRLMHYKLTSDDYQQIQNGQLSYWKQLQKQIFIQNQQTVITEQSQSIEQIIQIFEKQQDLQQYINYLKQIVNKNVISSILHDISVYYLQTNQLEKARKYNQLSLDLYEKDHLTTQNIEQLLTKTIINNDYKLALEILGKTYTLKINVIYRNHMESIAVDLLRKNNLPYIYLLTKGKQFCDQAKYMSLKNFALCIDQNQLKTIKKDNQQAFVDSISKEQFQFMRFYQYNQQLALNIKKPQEIASKSLNLLEKCSLNSNNKILIGVIIENFRLLQQKKIQFTPDQLNIINNLQNYIQ